MSFQNFRNVQVEEVAVENGLDDTSDDSDHIVETLAVVSINPVEDVEAAVGAETEQVVAGDRLGLARLAHHKKLWQNCDRFQINGKCPQNF